jgi:hypothetical protein
MPVTRKIISSFLCPALVLLIAACSDDGSRDASLTAYDACIMHARKELNLPKDTVFAWGTHRKRDAFLLSEEEAQALEAQSTNKENTKIIETWYAMPNRIGPPDSRSLLCTLVRGENGQWIATGIKTEKQISPGLGGTVRTE